MFEIWIIVSNVSVYIIVSVSVARHACQGRGNIKGEISTTLRKIITESEYSGEIARLIYRFQINLYISHQGHWWTKNKRIFVVKSMKW